MEIIYKISIGAIIFLGIAHIGLTFVKYKKIEPDALWFLSAGLALIFSGLINYVNLVGHSSFTGRISLSANVLLVLFSILLTFYIRKAQIFALALLSLLLLFNTLF